MARNKAKQLKVRRSASSKTADAKRIRFGGGMAPAAIRDSRQIRFGGGMMPAVLKK